MNEVKFYSADIKIPVKERKHFRECILQVFAREGYKLKRISYVFGTDEFLLNLNRQYLKHDFYTDVLTFLISENNKAIEGEVYMSAERIKENAKIYKLSYQKELLRVMIHGALHLCNYDDQTRKARRFMQQKEDFYIQLYNDSRET
jgi:rRNA maturation RNase YbeY